MKKDDELEQLLRGYEPVGPSASLRARVLAGQVRSPRAWPWVAAAAALLVATISLRDAADRTAAGERVDSGSPRTADFLADMMGGDDEAHVISLKIAALDESARLSAVPVATSGDNGDPQ